VNVNGVAREPSHSLL